MDDRDEDLIPLAEAVSDGAAVDWSAETSAHPEDAAILEQLRVVAKVAEVHRLPHPALVPRDDSQRSWGPLRIQERIGAGAFAEVHRVFDPALERFVALKLLRTDLPLPPLAGARFLDEARRLARVRHANVVTVHGADQHDGQVGLWMDLISGRTLERILADAGPFGPQEAVAIGTDLCRALAAIHRAGLVHGDVKTSNVIREDGGRIVLMDFGAGTELTGAGADEVARFGTPAAMAPEQLRGEAVGPESDIYGLGVLLYRLLTGRYPIEAPDLHALLDAHQHGAGQPLRDLRPDLPAGLVQAVERAMAPERSRRFASAGAMEQALGQALEVPSRRSYAWAWWSAAAAAAVLVAWVVTQRSTPPSTGESATIPAPESSRLGAAPSSSGRSSSSPTSDANLATGRTSAAPEPAAPAAQSAPITATARLYRAKDGVEVPLNPGDPIALGDGLFLELQSSSDLYVYVLDQDASGDVFVLYPAPGLDQTNPLPAGDTHRLPGMRQGRPFYWQATSPSGRETIMVLAARTALPDLEKQIVALPRAQAGTPVGGRKIGDDSAGDLRGIGGMIEAPDSGNAAGGRLAELQRLMGRRRSSQLWTWQIELAGAR